MSRPVEFITRHQTIAARLRLLADRLTADGTFGGDMVAAELREAADLLDEVADDRRQRFQEALAWTLQEHAETLRRLGEGPES